MVSNTPQENLQDWIGHDGSEMLFPELEDRGRRSFTAQECMIALYKYKAYKFLTIEMEQPCFLTEDKYYVNQFELPNLVDLLQNTDAVLSGLIHGRQHSLAWCSESKKLFDPSGFQYPLDKLVVAYAHLL